MSRLQQYLHVIAGKNHHSSTPSTRTCCQRMQLLRSTMMGLSHECGFCISIDGQNTLSSLSPNVLECKYEPQGSNCPRVLLDISLSSVRQEFVYQTQHTEVTQRKYRTNNSASYLDAFQKIIKITVLPFVIPFVLAFSGQCIDSH